MQHTATKCLTKEEANFYKTDKDYKDYLIQILAFNIANQLIQRNHFNIREIEMYTGLRVEVMLDDNLGILDALENFTQHHRRK